MQKHLKKALKEIEYLNELIKQYAKSDHLHELDKESLKNHLQLAYENVLKLKTEEAENFKAQSSGESEFKAQGEEEIEEIREEEVNQAIAAAEVISKEVIEPEETQAKPEMQPEDKTESADEEKTLKQEQSTAEDDERIAEKEEEVSAAGQKKEASETDEEDDTKREKEEEANQNTAEDGVKKPLYERFSKTKTSLNERFQSSRKSTGIGEKMQLKPISDLKSAISVNERIAFIKDLFDGDDKAYKKTIDFINKSSNYSEAKFYINSKVKNNFNWDANPEKAENFMELVYRKFL